ncbi:MAG: hypothetical protein U0575_07240 [Phycisphaerales bacterium]
MRIPTRRGLRPAAATAIWLTALALPLAGGCASTTGEGQVELRAAGRETATLRGDFVAAAFSIGPAATAIYLSDVPVEKLIDGTAATAQVVHMELFWKPRAGYTPLEDDSTNASVRYIVLVDGEVGVYGGAGMLHIHGSLDKQRTRFTLVDASMSLIDSTQGFHDRLSPAQFDADVVAVKSPEQAMRIRQAVSQRVTNAFGETRIVREESDQPAIAAIFTLR